jgi:hypothetical protein
VAPASRGERSRRPRRETLVVVVVLAVLDAAHHDARGGIFVEFEFVDQELTGHPHDREVHVAHRPRHPGEFVALLILEKIVLPFDEVGFGQLSHVVVTQVSNQKIDDRTPPFLRLRLQLLGDGVAFEGVDCANLRLFRRSEAVGLFGRFVVALRILQQALFGVATGLEIRNCEAAQAVFVEPPVLRAEEFHDVQPVGVELVLTRRDPDFPTLMAFDGLLSFPDGTGIVAPGGIEPGIGHAGQCLGLLVGKAFEGAAVGLRIRQPRLAGDQLGLPEFLEFNRGGGAQRDGALEIRCPERAPDLGLADDLAVAVGYPLAEPVEPAALAEDGSGHSAIHCVASLCSSGTLQKALFDRYNLNGLGNFRRRGRQREREG